MDKCSRFSRQRVGFAVLLGVAAATFAAFAFLPREWVAHNGKHFPETWIDSITILEPRIRAGLDWLPLICMLALLGVAIGSALRHRHVYTILAVIGTIGCPASGVLALPRIVAPWRVYAEERGPDGATYCFLESSFLQGQTLALARYRESGWFTRTFDVLVTTNGDNPRSFLRIVRPADAEDIYGQVYVTPKGFVLGVRSDNRCFMAYDLTKQQSYGHGAVEELSPFLCIGPNTRLHEGDLQNIRELAIAVDRGAPPRQALEAALQHPNPRVREFAAARLAQRQQ